MRSMMSLGKLQSFRSAHMSARWFGHPGCFYSTTVSKRPAVYLCNSITRAELFLVGVDHISPHSAEFVCNLIKDIKPHVVAVELCEKRAKSLLSGEDSKKLTLRDFFSIQGSLNEKILRYSARKLYTDVASKGLKTGQELRAAIEEGKAIGAQIAYIDQDIDVAMKRAAADFSLRQVWRCYWEARGEDYPHFAEAMASTNLFKEAFLKPGAIPEAQAFLHKYFPGLERTLVHERNEYMVRKLREMRGSIVGVVGALHIQGMRELWDKAEMEYRREKFPIM